MGCTWSTTWGARGAPRGVHVEHHVGARGAPRGVHVEHHVGCTWSTTWGARGAPRGVHVEHHVGCQPCEQISSCTLLAVPMFTTLLFCLQFDDNNQINQLSIQVWMTFVGWGCVPNLEGVISY